MNQLKFEALGTTWWINSDKANEQIQVEIKKEILKIVQDFENNYSRFKPNSQLSVLNRDRHYLNPSIEFKELIQIGLDYYKLTNGLFNIGLGKILANRGYDANYSFKPKLHAEYIPKLNQELILDRNGINLAKSNFQLDFGGFGKGYLIDKIYNFLKQESKKNGSLKSFLINGGGDIRVFGGEHLIWLQNPFQLEKALFQIKLKSGESLGASSNQLRKWLNYGHIINPKPNQTNIRSEFASFTIASSALEADIWATIYCILGFNKDSQIKTPHKNRLILTQDLQIKGSPDFFKKIV